MTEPSQTAANGSDSYEELYKIGATDPHGYEIEQVYGAGHDFAVYTTVKGALRWQYREPIPEELHPVIRAFHRIHSTYIAVSGDSEGARARWLRLWGRNKFEVDPNWKEMRALLAGPLVSAFKTHGFEDPPLKEADDYLDLKLGQKVRFNYVVSALGSGLFFGVAFYLATFCTLPKGSEELFRSALLACSGGAFGATLSVLQRGASLEVSPFVSRWDLRFQGGQRTLLGVAFGLAAWIIWKANLAFGAFDGNLAMYVVALAVGFSERYIPEILGKVIQEDADDDES